jgi:SNF2 family DNA or RNA helicase
MKLINDNQAVMFKISSNKVPLITDHLERCLVLNDDGLDADIVMAWGLEEMQHMTRVSSTLKIPSPIAVDYDWPGLYAPFLHQRTTSEFLSLRHRAFCFNEAGTGKTASVIWAADYLMNRGIVKRVLVICPLSIMYSAWQADIFKTAMHRTAGVAHGNATKRIKIINGEYEFVIINFDGMCTVSEEINKTAFDLIVVDECSAYKTASTKRWKTLAKLLKPSTRLWMLTGTPAAQSPLDAFGLSKLVSPDLVPKFFTAWRDKVMFQATQFKWVPRPIATQIVFNALQPAIRFTKAECLDLPDVVYQTREVPLTPQVVKYYKELKNQMLIEAAGEEISAVNAASRLTKLLQISGGAVYTDTHEVVEFDVSPRLKEMMDVINEASHKVLIFVPYTHTIELVSNHLIAKGVTNEIINGAVSASTRSSIITRFESTDEPRVLIIQPKAGAHGITLVAADTIIFWSPVMSVETYLQCIARMDRLGQVNKMLVVNLQGSEVERKMYEMLQGKVDDHVKLVDLYKEELGI